MKERTRDKLLGQGKNEVHNRSISCLNLAAEVQVSLQRDASMAYSVLQGSRPLNFSSRNASVGITSNLRPTSSTPPRYRQQFIH
jgi:hypothetical protein